jgi:hypothetical protein
MILYESMLLNPPSSPITPPSFPDVSTDSLVKTSDGQRDNQLIDRNRSIRVGVIIAGPFIRRLLLLQHSPSNHVTCRRSYHPLSSHRPLPHRLISSNRQPPAVRARTLPPPSSLQPPPHPDRSCCAVRCSSRALVTLSAHRRHSHHYPLLAMSALVAPSAARSCRAVQPPAQSTTTSPLQ